MENLGTEVGQKMRSAIKAKLIELGTGTTTGGYIDDELPDYVMIMVANKRSVQQMNEDLSLFLGQHTNIFVVWLHQVLEKLQEVTLPVVNQTSLLKKKKPVSVETSSRKDKKEKKKKSRNRDKTPENPTPISESPMLSVPSITDVFAEQFIQKAKQSIELEQNLPIKAKIQVEPTYSPEKHINNNTISNTVSKYEIPIITKIAESAVEAHLHQKELQELKELQEKIYQTKQQLKSMCSSDDENQLNIEIDDDDFLNIRATEDDIENVTGEIKPTYKSRAKRVPIEMGIYNHYENESFNQVSNRVDESPKKKSILDRLGSRNDVNKNTHKSDVASTGPQAVKNIISLSAHRREERELYTPHYRRLPDSGGATEKVTARITSSRSAIKSNISENDSPRKSSIKSTNHRERERTPEQKNKTIRNRMGSRCIVVPPANPALLNVYEESEIEVPVNSVVKIKPRPFIPLNKQANKYLLLRAVADAQKSTSSVKSSPALAKKGKKNASSKSKLIDNNARIITKAIQNTTLNRTVYQNVNNSPQTINTTMIVEEEEDEGVDVVEEILDDYMEQPEFNEFLEGTIPPQIIAEEIIAEGPILTNAEAKEKTQFVVTLDGHKTSNGGSKRVKLKRSIKDRIGLIAPAAEPVVVPTTNPKLSSPDSTTTVKVKTKIVLNRKNQHNDVKRTIQSGLGNRENNKIDEYTANRSKVSPIKFDLTDDESRSSCDGHNSDTQNDDESQIRKKLLKDIKPSNQKTVPSKQQKENEKSSSDANNCKDEDDGDQPSIKKIKKLESSRKFDNVPEVLSSVTIPTMESAVVSTTKLKLGKLERCKFFPFCNLGDVCEYMHPTANCKSFPNCKFGSNCNYIHPRCKFDKTCTRLDCNFAHSSKLVPVISSPPITSSSGNSASILPPLASSVVPVQNYKTISAATMPSICKFYPNCTNAVCNFFHPPKMCRFGKNCNNKLECNFYHHEPTPFKWVSPFSI